MNTNKYLFEDAPVPKAVATMAIPYSGIYR